MSPVDTLMTVLTAEQLSDDDSGAGSGMAGTAAAIPIWNLVWQRHANPMKFGQLILRKIIKIVATRCQILSLKCTKINFGWGSAPDPAGGAYSAPPDSLAGLKGSYF